MEGELFVYILKYISYFLFFNSSHNALVQNQVRKQGPLLDSSKLNTAEHINWVVSQLPVNNTSTVLDAHTGSGVTAFVILFTKIKFLYIYHFKKPSVVLLVHSQRKLLELIFQDI